MDIEFSKYKVYLFYVIKLRFNDGINFRYKEWERRKEENEERVEEGEKSWGIRCLILRFYILNFMLVFKRGIVFLLVGKWYFIENVDSSLFGF